MGTQKNIIYDSAIYCSYYHRNISAVVTTQSFHTGMSFSHSFRTKNGCLFYLVVLLKQVENSSPQSTIISVHSTETACLCTANPAQTREGFIPVNRQLSVPDTARHTPIPIKVLSICYIPCACTCTQ